MTFTTEELDYLRAQPLARFATRSVDGQPDVVPVSFEFDGECFWTADRGPRSSRPARSATSWPATTRSLWSSTTWSRSTRSSPAGFGSTDEPRSHLREHSDGWRGTNRVRGANGKRYEYPRYTFCNMSDDIKALFKRACARLGIEVRRMNQKDLSIAKGASVALLDDIVGPKSLAIPEQWCPGRDSNPQVLSDNDF